MGRIRTIKPEFPQSESMGRCSREARLLFILIWTIADDAGRARAALPLLASLLFPYDLDAPGLIDAWLVELEREGCVARYQVGGSTYLEVVNWSKHQRINRPSGPQCPEPSAGDSLPMQFSDDSVKAHGGLTEDSVRTHGAFTAGSGPLPLPLPGPLPGPPMSSADAPDRDAQEPQRADNTADDWGPTAEDLPHVPEEHGEPSARDDRHSGAVGRVFDHWRGMHNHPRARLDRKRERVIREALALYSEADLCLSITGYRNSPHHMGQNDRGTVYNDIALLLRDAAHIDAGLRFHAEPPRMDLSAQTRRIITQTEGWVPPEVRSNAT